MIQELLKLMRYSIVGLINTTIGYLLIFSLMYLNVNEYLSNFIGYMSLIIFSFFINRNFTFDQKKNTRIIRYILMFIGAYTFNLLSLYICVQHLFINPYYSQLIAGIMYILLFYILIRLFVFNQE